MQLITPYNVTVTATISKEGTNKLVSSRVLILGGTGRVGSSTATALSQLCPGLQIQVGGRNRERGMALMSSLGENSKFLEFDIYNKRMLLRALKGVDVVVNAVGPFKRREKCAVLEAAISTKTAYVDVCDDTVYALRAKGLHEKAIAAGIPALTTAGICPGVSNVMAAELVDAARNKDGTKPESLRFSYYVAGSGDVGPTMLESSMHLLAEDVIAYDKGKLLTSEENIQYYLHFVKLEPYSGVLNINFSKGIGKKDVYLLNLPEVRSAHEILKVPTVSARFGSEPFFWNWGMQAFARILRKETVRDKDEILRFVQLIDPLIRVVDNISGQSLSMRVDLDCKNGKSTMGLFTHKKLSVCAGYATAAFVLAVLEGSTQPGVWFPEEPEGIATEARKILLERATRGTSNFVMHKFFSQTDKLE
ncbi:Saccharopine dehydrogenase NADP binding domain-containing protein [Carex littledalei]|uniref:Saccharopine dehydrogenase NADP binding domain-containing protein n=1 Tax=Carex littledalei TaxID=544730 RepID=A0A833V739_9POAL|nr:Saccharopine dehydrogenase NADP binding domain-containing protein [Carex littledalei]